MLLYRLCKNAILWFLVCTLPVQGQGNQPEAVSADKTTPFSTVSSIAGVAQQIASIAMLSTAAVAAYYAIQQYKNDVRKPSSTIKVSDSFNSLGGKPPKEVRRLMEYIKSPETRERYKRFNVTPYKGILLYGPPGTGKTALARAIAGEAGVPFFSQKPSDILDRWIGGSEGNIAKIFSQAREAARSSASGMAIIFLFNTTKKAAF